MQDVCGQSMQLQLDAVQSILGIMIAVYPHECLSARNVNVTLCKLDTRGKLPRQFRHSRSSMACPKSPTSGSPQQSDSMRRDSWGAFLLTRVTPTYCGFGSAISSWAT